MTRSTALPFTLRRGSDVYHKGGILSITETVHGLLRLEAEVLTVEWRVHRATDRYGAETRSDQEVEPVRRVALPLEALGDAVVRVPWWGFGRSGRLVLTAAALEAFEALAGPAGLQLDHPARLEVRLRREDLAQARMFVADLALARSERALRIAGGDTSALSSPPPTPPSLFPGPGTPDA